MSLQEMLFNTVVQLFYSPELLPAAIKFGDKYYNMSYVREWNGDNSYFRAAAWDPYTGKDVAAVILQREVLS
jgi:hypothetical protein